MDPVLTGLLEALRTATLAPASARPVVDLALAQGVAPLLHERLRAAARLDALPSSCAQALARERRACALDNLRKYGAFRDVARTLDKAGIAMLPLKGLHLAERIYRDIGLRPMSDLDVLVPRDAVAAAVAALRAAGFASVDEHALERLLEHKCNVGLQGPGGAPWLELHWSLEEPRPGLDDPTPALWDAARPARLGDADTRVMPTRFLLLHVCGHLAINHAFAFSLRALCDIDAIVRAEPGFDWPAFADLARCRGWARGVCAALQLAASHLDTPVPPEVLRDLGADALEPGLLEDALEQMGAATRIPPSLLTAPNLLAVAGAGTHGRWRLLWSRIFVPREELAQEYGLALRSPRLPLYYAARVAGLLRRHARTLAALHGDPTVAAAARRHVRLQRWISAP